MLGWVRMSQVLWSIMSMSLQKKMVLPDLFMTAPVDLCRNNDGSHEYSHLHSFIQCVFFKTVHHCSRHVSSSLSNTLLF